MIGCHPGSYHPVPDFSTVVGIHHRKTRYTIARSITDFGIRSQAFSKQHARYPGDMRIR
jgi:hypothetical protein